MIKLIVWSLFDSGNGSYNNVFSKEPNINLELSKDNIKSLKQLDSINCYNERSNIPEKLVQKIIKKVKENEK